MFIINISGSNLSYEFTVPSTSSATSGWLLDGDIVENPTSGNYVNLSVSWPGGSYTGVVSDSEGVLVRPSSGEPATKIMPPNECKFLFIGSSWTVLTSLCKSGYSPLTQHDMQIRYPNATNGQIIWVPCKKGEPMRSGPSAT